MTDFSIREYKNTDIPQLRELWCSIFGDSEEFVNAFFELLPSLGCGLAAVCENRVVGCAYVLRGMELVQGSSVRSCAYIYAVATDPLYRGRGIGAALTGAACETARSQGADIITLQPAEDSLLRWYRDTAGFECALRRKKESFSCKASAPAVRISAAEYTALREGLLRGRNHIRFSPAAAELEEKLCICCGGGLYKVNGGLAAACEDSGLCYIPELIVPEAETAASVYAVAAAVGTDRALLCKPCSADEGEKYIASLSPLPEDCIWGLSFD